MWFCCAGRPWAAATRPRKPPEPSLSWKIVSSFSFLYGIKFSAAKIWQFLVQKTSFMCITNFWRFKHLFFKHLKFSITTILISPQAIISKKCVLLPKSTYVVLLRGQAVNSSNMAPKTAGTVTFLKNRFFVFILIRFKVFGCKNMANFGSKCKFWEHYKLFPTYNIGFQDDMILDYKLNSLYNTCPFTVNKYFCRGWWGDLG